MTVAAGLIVEAIDVVGDVLHRQIAILVDLLLDPFLLEATEEGLRDGVVPAVGLSAHARLQVIGAAEAAPGIAAVLRTLIRMNQCAAGALPANGHQHGVEDELTVKGGPR